MPLGLFNLKKKKSESEGEQPKPPAADAPTPSPADADGDAAAPAAPEIEEKPAKLTKEEKAKAKDDAKKAKALEKKVVRDPKKARRFFDHAETVADSRQYDYAIKLYIDGLHHDPDNMMKHEALREISLRRKVSGGKPAKFRETLNFGAKDKVAKMLHAELLWAKDPLNLQRMIDMMEKAVEADAAEDEFHLGELAYWVGDKILEKSETDKQPKKADILKVRDLFERVGAWEQAANATRKAMEIDPNDTDLPEQLKDIEAELAMAKGNYNAPATEAVRDKDVQQALDQESQMNKTEQAADQIIARRRAELLEKPEDVDQRLKLVKALCDRGSEATETEAIAILEKLLLDTKQHRHKTAIGDIRIRQFNRQLRDLKEKVTADPKDAPAIEAYKNLTHQRLEFELREFADRVKNYPTDMRWRYELGKRLMLVKRYDDAMTNFQQAKNDPKFRASAASYLGQAYIKQKWYDEAVETLQETIAQMTEPTSAIGLEIHWYLMTALYMSAIEHKNVDTAKESMKIASRILQTDVNYRDIKARLDQIRTLIKKLQPRTDAK